MRFNPSRGVLAATLAAVAIVAPALPVAAGDGSDYRSLSNAMGGSDYGRGIGIEASFSGRIHGADVDLPEGRVSFRADLRSGKAKLEVDVRLGDLAPLLQSYAVTSQDQRRFDHIRFILQYDPKKGLWGKGPMMNDFASVVGAKATTGGSSEGSSWTQIATPDQVNAVVASLAGAASLWSAANVAAQDAGYGVLANGLSAFGLRLTDNGDRTWTVAIDPKTVAGVLDAYAGPILLAQGGDPLARSRAAGGLAAQGAEAMRHTDGITATVRVNGESHRVSNVELRYRGEIDGARAEAKVRLAIRGFGESSDGLSFSEVGSSSTIASQVWSIVCGYVNACP